MLAHIATAGMKTVDDCLYNLKRALAYNYEVPSMENVMSLLKTKKCCAHAGLAQGTSL